MRSSVGSGGFIFSFSESVTTPCSAGTSDGLISGAFEGKTSSTGREDDDAPRESLDFLLITDFLPRVPTGTGRLLDVPDLAEETELFEPEALIEPGRAGVGGLSLARSAAPATLDFGVLTLAALDRTLLVLAVLLATDDTLAPESLLARC